MKDSAQSSKIGANRANATARLVSKGLKTIADNRPTMVAQRKLQGIVQEKGISQRNVVQRQITIGTQAYNTNDAENLVKNFPDFSWDDSYHTALDDLNKKNAKFKNIKELAYNLDYNFLGGYLYKAVTGYEYNYKNDSWEQSYLGWEQQHSTRPGAGNSLHDLLYNVLVDENPILGMSYDDITKRTPESQLAYCLSQCRDTYDDKLAFCLYTSYFYEPINNYFRGLYTPDESTEYGRLVVKTAEVLRGEYAKGIGNPESTDRRYRLELKSNWLADGQKEITFKALTSAHPELNGIKSMWSDAANGYFGSHDNLALLVFEETKNTMSPEIKYFPGEEETIMGPDTSYKVVEQYKLNVPIPDMGTKQIRVFHLSNNPALTSNVKKLGISDIVNIPQVEQYIANEEIVVNNQEFINEPPIMERQKNKVKESNSCKCTII